MAHKENIERQKSTRWAKASQANYSGDDWSDDEEEIERGDEVPKLPEIDIEQYDTSIQNTPNLSIEHKFQEIALDEEPAVYEEDDYTQQNGDDDVPVQSGLLEGDEDDEDDYKPTSSSRFNPIPLPPQLVQQEETEIQHSDLVHQEDPTSSFDPFPSDENHSEHEEEEPISELKTIHHTSSSHDEPVYSNEDEYEEQQSPQELQKEIDSIHNQEPETALVPEQIYHLSEEPYEYNDDSHDEQYENDSNQDDYSIAVPLGDTIDSDDDDEGDYVPKSRYHFQSNSEEFGTDLQNEANSIETPTQEHSNELESYDTNRTEDYSSQQNQSPILQNETASSPRFDIVPDSPRQLQSESESPTSQRSGQFPHPEQSHQVHQQSLDIPIDETAAELSDTDTLHIRDPDSDDEVQILEERQIIPPVPTTHAANISRNDDFREHAYLSSIISTPDPNEGVFERNDGHSTESSVPETHNEIIEDSQQSEELQSSSKNSTPVINRDSQFYSSVNDYFDDYADEQQTQHGGIAEEGEISSDDEVEVEEIHDNAEDEEVHSLTTISTHSSGSLSTGGPSIRSETGYNRSSKISDRTASFTNQSLHYQTDESHDEPGDEFSTSTSAENKSTLNPALSINFGHWRPNTDSFRDQFINDSNNTPPVPKLDNYTRNSRGEIVEEVSSIADSKISEVSSLKNITSNNNESILSPDKDKQVETYRTDSDSIIPVHISLGTPESTLNKNGNFHEDVKNDQPSTPNKGSLKIVQRRSTTTFDFKQIASLDNPSIRIERYKKAREEELNADVGLNDWIKHALQRVEIINYTSPSSNIVKQAYAEASSNPKKFQHHNNLGSILVKKTFHETSNTASSFAKGIFSRGKKIMKNSER